MSDQNIPPGPREKLQKLRSLMSRIDASRSDRGASLPSCKNENQHESTTPIVHLNDYERENQRAVNTRLVYCSNDNTKTTSNVIISVLFRCIEEVPYNPKFDANPDVCFNCRKTGSHRYKDCTFPKNYVFCLNCGRRGVEVHNCPRCYKAHREFEQLMKQPVEPMPPLKSIERSIERQREKSRARSRVRHSDESKGLREKSKCRGENNYCDEWPDSRAGGERRNREGRNPVRHDFQDSNNAGAFHDERKSRERKNPVWFAVNDFEDSRDAADFFDIERMNFIQKNDANDDTWHSCVTEYNNNISLNEKSEPADEPVKDFKSEFYELLAAIKHLPNETQSELVEYFLKERQALASEADWN